MCSTRRAPTIRCGQWIAFDRRHFFGLLLVDNNDDNVGQQIEVNYLTMAGGFNPRGYRRQVRAKIRPEGSPLRLPYRIRRRLSPISIRSAGVTKPRGYRQKVRTNAAKVCSLRLPLWFRRCLSPSIMMA